MAQTTMFPGMVNSPTTTLSSGITDSATTIPVTELGVFPDAPNIATIGTGVLSETIHYGAKSAATGAGNLTSVTREYNKSGTVGAKKVWSTGDIIGRNFTEIDYANIKANIEDVVSFASDSIATIASPTPTVDTGTKLRDATMFTGRISGGLLSDGTGAGQVKVTAGVGMIRTTDSVTGVIKSFNWDEVATLDLTDDSVNYIYIDYNGGSPIPKATVTRSDITFTDTFTLGRVYYQSTHTPTRRYIQSGTNIWNLASRMHERELAVEGFAWVSGAVVTQPANMKLKTTDGKYYLGINEITTTGKDTTGADRFILWYRKASDSGWNEAAPAASLVTNQWDDNSGTINTTVTNNRYTVQWIYILYDGSINVVLGYKTGDTTTSTMTLLEAEALQPASVPAIVSSFGTLVAKAIIAKDSASITEIQVVRKTFSTGSSADHATLTNLAYADSGHTGFAPNPYYDYATLKAAGCMVPVTTPATVDQAEIAAGAEYANYVYIEFAKNASTTVGAQFIQWDLCMPSDWNGGNLTAVIDWLTTGADTTNATKFILTARRYANNTNLATALTTGVTTAEQASAGAGYLNLMTETAAFTVTGTGNWIVFSLTRVAPAGTDLNATVRVLGMKIKYIRTLA